MVVPEQNKLLFLLLPGCKVILNVTYVINHDVTSLHQFIEYSSDQAKRSTVQTDDAKLLVKRNTVSDLPLH